MKVADVMTKDVISVDKDEDLRHVLSLMKKHDITKVPVLENKQFIGIATDNMIAYKLGSRRKRMVQASRLHASTVTNKKYEAVSPDTDVKELMRKVGAPGLTMLPVLDKGKLVGVITKADLLPLVTSQKPVSTIMREEVFSVASDDRVVHARRVMLDNKVARLPVVDQGKLLGMISDMEIAFAFASLKRSFSLGRQKHQLEELLVRDVMKTPAVWIQPTMRIADAAKVMLKMNAGALPLLTDEVIAGIVSRTDVLRTVSL